ncbi:hypothetical protein Tcan_07818 [Toxocara canis]|uniref:Uncharacterized protein n=1 Tax=Toxocara canis TaxID=6265 RepID=A0A0B2VYU3_TOXCA|nr:hypothetical protein Tcan_07818 [Toxocara canis]
MRLNYTAQQAYGAPEVEPVENSVKRVGVRIQPRIRRGFERRTKIPLPLPVDKERTPVFEAITIAPSASS